MQDATDSTHVMQTAAIADKILSASGRRRLRQRSRSFRAGIRLTPAAARCRAIPPAHPHTSLCKRRSAIAPSV
jgi:hypothetical protein